MILLVEKLTGGTTTYDIEPCQTVGRLKQMIWQVENIPTNRQGLVFREREMSDNEQLQHYNISSDSCVKLIVMARSGPISYRGQHPLCNRHEQTYESPHVMQCDCSSNDALFASNENLPLYSQEYLAQNKKTNEHTKDDPSRELSSFNSTDSTNFLDRQAGISNFRTFCRMRDLRSSMERLNQENLRRKQNLTTKPPACDEEGGALTGPKPRIRRQSGSASSSFLRYGKPISGRVSFSQQQRDFLFMSAEDTSAKESSAGETELDDQMEQTISVHVGGAERNFSQLAKDIICNDQLKNAKFKIEQSKHCWGTSHARSTYARPSCNERGRRDSVVQLRQHQKFVFLRSSSCSDIDHESSALFSSNFEPPVDQESDINSPNDDFVHCPYQHIAQLDVEPPSSWPRPFVVERRLVGDDYDVDDDNQSDGPVSSGVVTCNELSPPRRCKMRKKLPSASYRNVSVSAPQRPHVPPAAPSPRHPQSDANDVGDAPRLKTVPVGASIQLVEAGDRAAVTVATALKAPTVLSTTTGDETSSDEQEIQRRSGKVTVGHVPISQKYKVQSNRPASSSFKRSTNFCVVGLMSSSPPAAVGSFSVAGVPLPPQDSPPASTLIPLGARQHKLPQSSQSQQRCNSCGCRLSAATTFQCRCGKTLCGRHRHGPAHACGHDTRRLATTPTTFNR